MRNESFILTQNSVLWVLIWNFDLDLNSKSHRFFQILKEFWPFYVWNISICNSVLFIIQTKKKKIYNENKSVDIIFFQNSGSKSQSHVLLETSKCGRHFSLKDVLHKIQNYKNHLNFLKHHFLKYMCKQTCWIGVKTQPRLKQEVDKRHKVKRIKQVQILMKIQVWILM